MVIWNPNVPGHPLVYDGFDIDLTSDLCPGSSPCTPVILQLDLYSYGLARHGASSLYWVPETDLSGQWGSEEMTDTYFQTEVHRQESWDRVVWAHRWGSHSSPEALNVYKTQFDREVRWLRAARHGGKLLHTDKQGGGDTMHSWTKKQV